MALKITNPIIRTKSNIKNILSVTYAKNPTIAIAKITVRNSPRSVAIPILF